MNKNNLDQWKNETEHIHSKDINPLIHQSMKKAKHDTLVHHIKVVSLCFFLPVALFTTLINTSQQFVSAINHYSIIGDLSKMLTFNPSIYYARNTDYFKKIDQTFEKDTYQLYVESMIVDEDMAVVFYKVKLKDNEHHFEKWNFNNYRDKTAIIPSGINMDPNELQYVQFNPEEIISDTTFEFEFSLDDNTDPNEITRFNVENDLSKLAQPQTFKLNQTVEFEGQKITIQSIDVYPMSTNIIVSQDPNNTHEILNYLFAFYDENGNKIAEFKNGISGQEIDEFTDSIKLEAPYGLKNKLTLVLEEVRWVEKEGADILFDPVTKKIQNLPSNLIFDSYDEEKVILKPDLNSIETSKDTVYTFEGIDATTYFSASGKEIWIIIPYTSFQENEDQMLVLKNTYGKMHQINLNITTIDLEH